MPSVSMKKKNERMSNKKEERKWGKKKMLEDML